MTVEQFLLINPSMRAALEDFENNPTIHAKNKFAHDVVNKFRLYGRLSPAQLNALINSLKRDHERAAEPKGEAPEGLQTVTGKVLSIKEKTDHFGTRWKMTVRLENNARVYATVPKGAIINEGDTVTFHAEFERAKDDPSFAFGKRPKLVAGAALTPPVTTLGELAASLSAPAATATVSPAPAKPEAAAPSILAGLLAELEEV